MTSQIFKNKIPNEILIQLLQDIAVKTDKCYILSNASYKKGIFNETIIHFINQCKPYYHSSKLHKGLVLDGLNFKKFFRL